MRDRQTVNEKVASGDDVQSPEAVEDKDPRPALSESSKGADTYDDHKGQVFSTKDYTSICTPLPNFVSSMVCQFMDIRLNEDQLLTISILLFQSLRM